MWRAAIWTAALFGLGTLLCQLFPNAWLEPLVLMALGVAMLFVSSRPSRFSGSGRERAVT
jgi:hypothetical protein